MRFAPPALLACALLAIGMGPCKPAIPLMITSPDGGIFHALSLPPGSAGNDLTVTGKFRVHGLDPAHAKVELFVNEIPSLTPVTGTLTTVGSVTTFSADVNLDPRTANSDAEPHLNTVYAVLTSTADPSLQQRAAVTVVVGLDAASQWDSTADPAVALRLNQGGLDRIAASVGPNALAAVDLSTLAGQALPSLCFPEPAPGQGCAGIPISITVDGVSPGPSNVSITPHGTTSPTPSQTQFRIELADVEVDFHLEDAPTDPIVYCAGTLTIDPLTIDAYLNQIPSGGQITVDQIGLDVTFGSFVIDFPAFSLCGYPSFENYLIATFGPDLEAEALTLVANQLNGSPRPLIEEAVETEIANLDLGAGLAQALLMDLNADFTSIDEDDDGIRYLLSSAATPIDSLCDQGQLFPGACPDLAPERLRIPLLPGVPVWGALAPNGQPYELALGLSESFLNQVFAGFTETGGLAGEITERAACDDGTPSGSPDLTAGCLFGSIPSLLQTDLAPGDPVSIRFYPTVAPVLPGGSGPLGSQAALQIAGLHLELRKRSGSTSFMLVDGLIRLNGGLSVAIDDPNAGGTFPPGVDPPTKLEFDIEYCTTAGTCDPDATFTTLREALHDPLGQLLALEGFIDIAINAPQPGGGPSFLEAEILPQLSESIGAFTLPSLIDTDLAEVQSVPDQTFLGLFFDMVPVDNGDPNPN